MFLLRPFQSLFSWQSQLYRTTPLCTVMTVVSSLFVYSRAHLLTGAIFTVCNLLTGRSIDEVVFVHLLRVILPRSREESSIVNLIIRVEACSRLEHPYRRFSVMDSRNDLVVSQCESRWCSFSISATSAVAVNVSSP